MARGSQSVDFGVRLKNWTGLPQYKAHPVFDGALGGPQGDLDPLLVVPTDVRDDHLYELLNGGGLPFRG